MMLRNNSNFQHDRHVINILSRNIKLGGHMKSLLIGLAFALTSQASFATARAFRIDNNKTTVNGYAIAWGIPGVNTDFEKLDALTDEEILKELDTSSVVNYIVDIEKNKIITTIDYNDMVDFRIGTMGFGNHYSLWLSKLAVTGVDYETDVIAMTESFKWNSSITKIILNNSRDISSKHTEIDGGLVMHELIEKVKKSILPANLHLFEDGSENITSVETKRLDSGEEVNVFKFSYEIPKGDDGLLEVETTVRLKYENGKMTPYVLAIKQNKID